MRSADGASEVFASLCAVNPSPEAIGEAQKRSAHTTTALRSVITNQRRYVATASANGKTLLTNYPQVIRTTFSDNTRTEMGLSIAYRVPGQGLILINTGRLVLDRATGDVIFSAGPHDVVEGNVSAFCDYFAP